MYILKRARTLAFGLILAVVTTIATTRTAHGATAHAPSVDATTIVAVYNGTAPYRTEISLTGSGFGAPVAGAYLFVKKQTYAAYVASTNCLVWTDSLIIATVPVTLIGGSIEVFTSSGNSGSAVPIARTYQFQSYPIPPTPGTNAHPLAIAADNAGRVWDLEEYHLNFQLLAPGAAQVVGLTMPHPEVPPFAMTMWGDDPSQTSVMGEDVIVDPSGGIWLAQGGSFLYNGVNPNHSRIVNYNPTTQAFRVYNIPGDNNEVNGLTWDVMHDRIWFTENNEGQPAKIASFNPDKVPFDNDFNFDASLDTLLCQPGEDDTNCIHEYPLPYHSFQMAHLVLDGTGNVWFTDYWPHAASALGRLHPATGAVDYYPLSYNGLSQNRCIGLGPWQIAIGPSGEVVATLFFAGTIVRMSASNFDNPACVVLDSYGNNPCVQQVTMPVSVQTHSIAYDSGGNLWFANHGNALLAGVGYLKADWSRLVYLPLGPFMARQTFSGAGITIDPVTKDIFVSDYFNQAIGRLTRIR
jgi:streptogramin lyase